MMMFLVKALVAYSSSTEARTAVRKPRSDAVIDKTTTVRTGEAATSDISRHGEESTSDEVSGTRHSFAILKTTLCKVLVTNETT